MSWMPILLGNLSKLNSNFKYHGLDIVESVINKSNLKYGRENKNWLFSVYDVSEGDLPSNYDLILSKKCFFLSIIPSNDDTIPMEKQIKLAKKLNANIIIYQDMFHIGPLLSLKAKQVAKDCLDWIEEKVIIT